jgi:hypothetical protein
LIDKGNLAIIYDKQFKAIQKASSHHSIIRGPCVYQALKILLRGGVILLSLFFSAGLAGAVTLGHVGFFYISPVKTDADFEVHDDFQHYYKNITPWLVKNGLSFSYHSKVPITLNLGEDTSLTLQKDDLKGELGFILSKGDGSHKILYGVHTGVDIMMAVRDFFDIHTEESGNRTATVVNSLAQKYTAEASETELSNSCGTPLRRF